MRRALCLLLLLSGACSDDADPDGDSGGGGGGGGAGQGGSGDTPPVVTELFPGAAPLPGQTECKVTITTNLPHFGASHHPLCTELTYQTNPPSSGDHWSIWAQFRTYTTEVPRGMYVHNLEHGAVVMAYDCPSGCADVAQAFEDAANEFGVDPLCAASPTGAERSRVIITPDPELDKPIGIAAWRATYVATCIDPPSLLDFIEKNYAKAPENTCSDGKDPDDPATGVILCQ